MERIGQAMLRALIETGEIEDAHIAGPKWNPWRDSSLAHGLKVGVCGIRQSLPAAWKESGESLITQDIC